jgi:hypothetical protein
MGLHCHRAVCTLELVRGAGHPHVTCDERMGLENTILCRGTHESTVKDLELQVTYSLHSEAEDGRNLARQQLDLTHEEVETRTHMIMHLENAIELQDLELDVGRDNCHSRTTVFGATAIGVTHTRGP